MDLRRNKFFSALPPALATFGLGAALAAPVLTLFDNTGRERATNTRWASAANSRDVADAAARTGAFPFASNSADSALLVTLPARQLHSPSSGGGRRHRVGLIEAYDAETLSNEGSRAINISTRGHVGTGDNILVAGFVISGAASRRVLIRAVGPSLAQFGLTGLLRNHRSHYSIAAA